jgi:hypothetical protein
VEDGSRKIGFKRRIKAMDRKEWRKVCEAGRFFKSCEAVE